MDLPSGKQPHNYGKIHHAINGKTHYKWPFSIAMLVYQRVYTLSKIAGSTVMQLGNSIRISHWLPLLSEGNMDRYRV